MNQDMLEGETVSLFKAERDDMGYKKSWKLIVGESYNPVSAKDRANKHAPKKPNVNFEMRIFHEHAKLLEKIGCVLPEWGVTDYSNAPYSIVLKFDEKHQARRISAAFNQLNEVITIEQANERAKPVPPVLYDGKFRSAEEVARLEAEKAKQSPVIAPVEAPAIVASPEPSLEARLARVLADAEAIYSAMPSAMTAQLLFNARYLNGIKPQSEKAQVEAHLLAKIGTVKQEEAA